MGADARSAAAHGSSPGGRPRLVAPAAAAGQAGCGAARPLLLSALYSPAATTLLSGWLSAQLPAPVSPPPGGAPSARPVAVLVGRGPAIAAATTDLAADRLVALGVNPARIAGDSCARTTWENATDTADWLRQHHPGAPVLLITDPWQLPRASRAFVSQGLHVTPLAAEPNLDGATRNRLALRETATLLYRLQGRF